MRSLALLAVMAVLAAGCSLGSAGSHTSAPPGILAPPLSHYRANGISFSYPAAWSHRGPGSGAMGSLTGGVVDLSTQAMRNPCHTAGNTTWCGFPIARLKPGGVFVAWVADYELVRPGYQPPAGRHVKVTRPGPCSRVDATETIVARVDTPNHASFSLQACLRAPDVAAGERAVRAMVASARASRVSMPLIAFHGRGVSFSYPASWTHHRPGYVGMESDGIVDLSTQRMVNPCRHHGNITSCTLPINHLRRDGVVVTWTIDGLPRAPSSIARPRVHIKVSRPGYCQTNGGEESILAQVVTRQHEMLWMDACLRGPNLAANERAVRAMLASAIAPKAVLAPWNDPS